MIDRTKATVVVDVSVVSRLIDASLIKILGTSPDKRPEYEELRNMLWVLRLLDFQAYHDLGIKSIRLVMCIDSKPYWRSDAYKLYKANRKPMPEGMYSRVSRSINWAKSFVLERGLGIVLEASGFEADDMAGAVYRERESRKHVGLEDLCLLNTIDTDWLGLVDDDLGVVWADTTYARFESLRDENGCKSWVKFKKFKKSVAAKYAVPRDIFIIKQELGDSSDNLASGCDIGLIDLINPIIRYEAPIKYTLHKPLSLYNDILSSIKTRITKYVN